MATLKYISADPNLQAVSLASAYTAGDGHMHLTAGHGARLPATGDFWLRTPITGTLANIFKCTARTDDQITIAAVTGYGADQNLPTGTGLCWVLAGESLDQLRTDINREMTVAAFDALASTEYQNGDRILLTDSLYEICRIGGAWSYRYGTQKVTRPPSTGWSWDNQVSSTIDSTNGYEYLIAPSQSAAKCSWRYRTAPSTPYTVTARFLMDITGTVGYGGLANTAGIMLLFRESSTGKAVSIRYDLSSNSWGQTDFDKWTSSTSYSAAYASYGPTANTGSIGTPMIWNARITDDATNLKMYLSIDGIHWQQFSVSKSRTDFMAGGPDQIGWGAYCNSTTVVVALIDWTVT